MATTPHEADLINKDRREQADAMRERLEKLGVTCSVAHYTGDSSYPTEYTLSYGDIRAGGPTFDMAVAELIEKLLKINQVAQLARLERDLAIERLTEQVALLRETTDTAIQHPRSYEEIETEIQELREQEESEG